MKSFLPLTLTLLIFSRPVVNDDTEDAPELDSEVFGTGGAKLGFSMSPRCRYMFTKFNQERRYANLLINYAIESIEKSNGKAVAALLEEHIMNVKTILLSSISGSSQAVRQKLSDWLFAILKLRELLLTTKLKGSALQFEEAMCNIARMLIEIILCIYH